MTEDQARELLKKRVRLLGTQKDAAIKYGISHSYMRDVLHGRRSITARLAKQLGLGVRRVFYTLKGA